MRARVSSLQAIGLTGVLFAILALIAALLLEGRPDLDAGPDEIATWLGDGGNRSRVLAGGLVMLMASIALLWFIGVLRQRIGDREDRLFATVFLGSGLMLIAMNLVAYAALAVPVTLAGRGAMAAAVDAFPLGNGLAVLLLAGVSPRMAAVFMLSLSNLGRATRAFPVWWLAVTVAAAIVLLVATTLSIRILWVFIAWVFVFGWVIVLRRDQIVARAGERGEHPARP